MLKAANSALKQQQNETIIRCLYMGMVVWFGLARFGLIHFGAAWLFAVSYENVYNLLFGFNYVCWLSRTNKKFAAAALNKKKL